jgi:hypothetical protein
LPFSSDADINKMQKDIIIATVIFARLLIVIPNKLF